MNKMVKSLENKNKVTNFMGGISYEINPLDTLKMITASSIFGEPAYYRTGEFETKKIIDSAYKINELFVNYSIIDKRYEGKKTSDIMENAIDAALTYDFKATLEWAIVLRHDYYMRLNPQVIMVRASTHPDRIKFTKKYPGDFNRINKLVMSRADEPATQLTYWLYRAKSKKKIPSILKRSWANKLSSLSRYELYKYKNAGLGIIDTVRVCHANSKDIDELMKTGTLKMAEEKSTWETLRSQGKSWLEIINTIDLPSMALTRNIRGIFTEINNINICHDLMNKLKVRVGRGKQFPFRYWSAMKAIELASDVNHKSIILDTLEECIDIAIKQLPKLEGKTMCLSDNSGSAWGTFNSEYGSVTIAEIDNLSSVITAMNSDEGYVGKFGDRLIIKSVLKRNGALSQTRELTRNRDSDVGGSTENGIWLFFDNAIQKKVHWDNIFIYSDQQAGHGGLYGTDEDFKKYKVKGFAVGTNSRYIDVNKLIVAYRKEVNPKVNVFSIQTAGYDNVCIPEYGYRTNILYGWTGKELQFAKTIIDFWNDKEKSDNNENKYVQ
ncbi:MAG: hypothetical protein FWC41_00450 [Firmicutes bacterium]|nr:hypothetical protein [Bacillota bacterium]